MDIRELETLRAVRTHGGVTAAAAALRLTPSAVSQQLASLQAGTGVALTERVGRGIRLTAAGSALADAAVDVAVALERARTACERFLDRPSGAVTISAFHSAALVLLPPLLTRIQRIGEITLTCSDADLAQADFAAQADRVDVVIAHRPDADPGSAWTEDGARLQVVPLVREPLDVAVAVGDPLASRDELRLEDLADQDWICVQEGFPVAGVLEEIAARSGLRPRIAHRINDFHVIEALVARGHGISLLPRYSSGRTPGVRLVPLAGIRSGRRIDALLRPDRAERLVVRTVVGELQAVAAALAGGRAGGNAES